MPLCVKFELSDEDLEHFRELMRNARASARQKSQDEILQGGRELLTQVRASNAPAFVLERLVKLETMMQMLDDQKWQLPPIERARVLNALAYFSEPCDLIPDHVVGLGFLDDAIMIQLVVDELKHEIEAYEEFCSFRKEERARRDEDGDGSPVTRKDWLESKRQELHGRMRRRSSALDSLFSLFSSEPAEKNRG